MLKQNPTSKFKHMKQEQETYIAICKQAKQLAEQPTTQLSSFRVPFPVISNSRSGLLYIFLLSHIHLTGSNQFNLDFGTNFGPCCYCPTPADSKFKLQCSLVIHG